MKRKKWEHPLSFWPFLLLWCFIEPSFIHFVQFPLPGLPWKSPDKKTNLTYILALKLSKKKIPRETHENNNGSYKLLSLWKIQTKKVGTEVYAFKSLKSQDIT